MDFINKYIPSQKLFWKSVISSDEFYIFMVWLFLRLLQLINIPGGILMSTGNTLLEICRPPHQVTETGL